MDFFNYVGLMTESVPIDIEKLVTDKIEKGVVGSSLCLENRKLGDEGISKLANLEILSEVVCLELGENNNKVPELDSSLPFPVSLTKFW